MTQFEPSEDINPTDGIREILFLLGSWGWLIIVSGLLAGIAAYIVSSRSLPIYQTSTRLLVSDPPSMRSLDYTGIVGSQTMTRTYAEMLMEGPVLQGMIDRLLLTRSPEELRESVSVEMVSETQLLVINVEDPNALLAADIANAIAAFDQGSGSCCFLFIVCRRPVLG